MSTTDRSTHANTVTCAIDSTATTNNNHKVIMFSGAILVIGMLGYALALPVGDEFNTEALRQLSLGKANDDFGVALLSKLEHLERAARKSPEDAKNLLVSPFSVSTVMAMVLAGTRNATHEQIFKSLYFNPINFKTDSDLFGSYKTLFAAIRNQFNDDKRNELKVANSIALQKNYPVLQTFLDTVTTSFDSKVFAEDFRVAAHQSTEDINRWVAEKTNGKIAKLFGEDLDATTVMVLLNAIYFKGTWKTRFDKEKTVSSEFHLDSNKAITTQTMNVRGNFRFAFFEDGQMVELPYSDSLSMLVFLPDEKQAKQHDSLSANIGDSVKFAERIAHLRNDSVNVHLPKFKIESEFSLKEALQAVGINDAFDMNKANFAGINGREHDLYLSQVKHKTFIEVNEEGAEAAAATGGVINTRAMPHHIEFNANRPFWFAIRDNLHQLTLFTGVVNKP